MHTGKHAKSGLTFVEVLLAIVLLTLIMGTASHVLYALVHFWQQTEAEPILTQHAEGVTGFLGYLLDRSADLSPSEAHSRHGWQAPPGENRPTFYIRLDEGHPFFVTEVRPFPRVDAWLGFKPEEGLYLVWHIPPRFTGRRVSMQRTVLSTLVRDVEIGYLDSERAAWIYESLHDEAADARRGPPGALRIYFEKDGQEEVRSVRLRRHARHVLAY